MAPPQEASPGHLSQPYSRVPRTNGRHYQGVWRTAWTQRPPRVGAGRGAVGGCPEGIVREG